MNIFIGAGSISAMLAVLLGAFGAHGVKNKIEPALFETYQTAVEYHFYHALGLLLVGIIAAQYPQHAMIRWSGWTMLAGTLVFSGSLYVLSLSGLRWLGAITPIGGVLFIVAWALLAWSSFGTLSSSS